MRRLKPGKYTFEDRSCIRCGINIVLISKRVPQLSDVKPPSWEGACEYCRTEEEKRQTAGSGLGHLLVGHGQTRDD